MTEETAPPMEVQMVEAYVDGDMELAQEMLDDTNVRKGITQPDNIDPTRLAPMPDAPQTEAPEVESAIAKLSELGGDHAQLVHEWGGDFGENLAYAKAAFTNIVRERPDLIEKVDAAGLGNDPAVLKLLAQHGRMSAGMMGDFEPMTRHYDAPNTPRISSARPSSKRAAQQELDELYRANPPGTDKYKDPKVQRRIGQLASMIGGDDSIVGQGGRTA